MYIDVNPMPIKVSMKTCLLLIVLLTSTHAIAQHKDHTSAYAGEEARAIKSLSLADIDELSKGHGWGFAKVAELNGIPGPKHVLEMEKEIELTSVQRKSIHSIFKGMQEKAIELGKEFIKLEAGLNTSFSSNQVNPDNLRAQLDAISNTRSKLRFIHLSAHLETVKILTEEQVKVYNELRGYASGDVCKEVPEGHDAELWKKHNNCN